MSRLILSSRATAVIVAIMVAFVLGVLVGQKDVRDGVRDDMRKCKVDNYCHSKGANFSVDAFGRVKVHEDGKKKGRP